MQGAHTALTTISSSESLVPPVARLVESSKAERDLCTLLAIALARLTLLDARAPGICKLSAANHSTWYQILLTDNLDRLALIADGRPTLVQVVQQLSRRRVSAQEDADL